MGRVSRHAGFPFADTETLTGPDLEHDIGGLINEVNGRLDDTNVDASAGITAAQLKQLTITDREIEPNTITTAQMAAASVGDSDFNEDNTLRALTTDTSTYQTFTGLAALSVTPGSTSDKILIGCQFCLWHPTASAESTYSFLFDIDGTDDTSTVFWARFGRQDHRNFTGWSVIDAPGTSAVAITLQHRLEGGDTGAEKAGSQAACVFALVLPQRS
jgi:hypothetical protein